MVKIAVVAGEASGDIHAANLVTAIRKTIPDVSVAAIGGQRLASAGARILYPMEKITAMGIIEVLSKLGELSKARKAVTGYFDEEKPDLFIPVDFGGFNLKLAAEAKKRGIPVIYFIPPKAWAWGAGRVAKVRELVREVLVILPFEEKFWRERGVAATYVGSPVLDHLRQVDQRTETGTVGLLPGSRVGEIERIWPVMAGAARIMARGRKIRFLVGTAEGLPPSMPDTSLLGGLDFEEIKGDSQTVMERSRMVIAASGTVTLECALVGVPVTVVYNMNPITVAIARRIVKTPYVSLPNLVAGRAVADELIQADAGEIAKAALGLFDDGTKRDGHLAGLSEIRARIGGPGASARAAAIIAERLRGGFPETEPEGLKP